MFYIILLALIISGFMTAIKFPNLTSKFTSKLPKLNASRWFSNPKIKTLLRDREYFSEQGPKLLQGPLFVVIGQENFKLYNLLSEPNVQGVKKNS